MRQEVGEGLLDGGKLVVAHPVRTNAFIATYTYNFPHDDINCENYENYFTQDDIVSHDSCARTRGIWEWEGEFTEVCLMDNATFYIAIHTNIRFMKCAAIKLVIHN